MAFVLNPNSRPGELPTAERPPMPQTQESGQIRIEKESIQEVQPMPVQELPQSETQAVEALRAESVQSSTPIQAAPATKDELEQKIDTILEADLKNVYRDLPEKLRPEFKKRGEEAARKIKSLIESAKATAVEIANILRRWLKIIPETGKFFVEQVVKIKTDQLIELTKLARMMT